MEKIDILYEDSHVIVCVKPAGVPVQTRQFGVSDMESLLKNHLNQSAPAQTAPPYLAVIHRLDQPVRGVLVFGKTPSAAKSLSQQMQSGKFTKIYHALLCGALPQKQGTLTDYLVKDGRTNTSRICSSKTPGAKKAELDYRVLDEAVEICGQKVTEVEIRLKTGRHHQIRVQMAGAGAPLLYDNKYNPAFAAKNIAGRGRDDYHPIALCACELSFTHPKTGKKMQFKTDCGW